MRTSMRLIVGFTFAALVALAGEALALPTGIYFTDQQMDPKSKTFEKDLKKQSKTAIKKDGDGWKLYFVAYLNKAAGANEVNIVFYEIGGGKREQINAFPVGTQDNARIIMSEVQLSPELSFKSGGKYDALITRLIGGKEVVYAKTRIELK